MNNTIAYSSQTSFILQINDFISEFIFYSSITIVVPLILGNILNILICARKNIRKEIIGIYNVVISIWNILALSFGLSLYFPASISIQDLTLTSDFLCVTINYVMRVSVQMSAWLYVIMTIDRYLCVQFNNKLKFIFDDPKKLSLIFVGLFAIICGINIPNLFFRVSLDDQSNLTCSSTPLINKIRNMMISIFRIILPMIFQVVFSTLLIYKLFKVRRRVNSNQSMEKEYKFARTILWLNLMFIITETPYLLTTFYFSFLGVIPQYPLNVNASHSIAIMTVAFYVTTLFSLYLFGSLFFVNLFTNKLFQTEIKLIFTF